MLQTIVYQLYSKSVLCLHRNHSSKFTQKIKLIFTRKTNKQLRYLLFTFKISAL
jgi:hypothetical protein